MVMRIVLGFRSRGQLPPAKVVEVVEVVEVIQVIEVIEGTSSPRLDHLDALDDLHYLGSNPAMEASRRRSVSCRAICSRSESTCA